MKASRGNKAAPPKDDVARSIPSQRAKMEITQSYFFHISLGELASKFFEHSDLP